MLSETGTAIFESLLYESRGHSRGLLVAVLREWQAGRLSATGVHEWAKARYFPGHLEVDDEEESGSAAVEVLARLDMLDIDLIAVDDIPHYLELHSPHAVRALRPCAGCRWEPWSKPFAPMPNAC